MGSTHAVRVGVSRAFRNAVAGLPLIATLILGIVWQASQASLAAIYIYTPSNSTTDRWSLGTNWNSPPVSGDATTLVFVGDNTTVLSDGLANTNTNDLSGPFSLNVLKLQGTGPDSGSGRILINAGSGSNCLSFLDNGSTAPVVQLNAMAGNAGLNYYVSGSVSLSTDTSFQGDGTASFNFDAVIGGSGGLTKRGTSTLVLAGVNTYTGGTNIDSGTLSFVKGALGTTGDIVFTGSATLQWKPTNRQDISGSGRLRINDGVTATLDTGSNAVTLTENIGLNSDGTNSTGGVTKAGSGVLTLVGAHTYTGITTVSAGTLAYGGNDVISTGAVTVNGGVLSLRTYSDSVGTVTVNGGSITGSGTLTSTGSFEMKSGSVSAVLAGVGVALNKSTSGTVTLSAANTYTGGTNIGAGTLSFASGALGTTGNVAFTGNSTLQWNGANQQDVSSSGRLRINDGVTATLDTGSNAVTLTENIGLDGDGTNSTGGMTKVGSGVLTFIGANTYTGTTTVSAGTLAYGGNDAVSTGAVTVNGGVLSLGTYSDSVGTVTINGGSITGSGTLTSTGSFEMKSGSVSAVLAGAGVALNKSTSGTVTLSAANTYTGVTTVSAGTLAYGSNDVISTGAVTVNGGVLSLGTYSDSVGTVTVNGGSITGSGTLTSTGSFEMKSGSVSAVLAGAGVSLNKSTSGTMTLSGANTCTGDTKIAGGTLLLANGNALACSTLDYGNYGGALSFGSLGAATFGGIKGEQDLALGAVTLTVGVNNQSTAYSGAINGAGGITKSGSGTLTLGGANTYAGDTKVVNGTLLLADGNALAGSTLDYGNYGGTLSFGSVVAATFGGIKGGQDLPLDGVALTVGANGGSTTYSGALSGSGSVTKTGVGTLTLTGANSLTGGMNVRAGILAVSSTAALPRWNVAGAFSVASDAALTLGDSFTDEEAVAVLGTGNFAPGSAFGFDVAATRTFDGSILPVTVGLAKSGPGTLTLTQPMASTSGAVISSGTGILDLGGFTQETSGIIVIRGGKVRNGTLRKNGGNFNVETGTISANLADGACPAGLVKNGSGKVALSGDNSFSGGVVLNQGELYIGSPTALGTGTFSIGGNGACMITAPHATTTTLSTDNAMVWNGDFTFGDGGSLNLGNGPVTLGADCVITCTMNTLTVGGTISGDHSLTKAGGDPLRLSGVNTFTGGITLEGNELQIDNGQALGTGAFTINNACSECTLRNTSGADITLSNNNPIVFAGPPYPVVRFAGNSMNLGRGPVTLLHAETRIAVLDETQVVTVAGDISGQGKLFVGQTGSGTLVLAGHNTYSGGTYVNRNITLLATGTAALPGYDAPGKVTVRFMATLAVNYGGGGSDWTSADMDALRDNASFEDGSCLGFDTTNATAGAAYGSVITGDIDVIKFGTNTLTLSGANTYSGATTIRGGMLTLGNPAALQDSTLLYDNYGGSLSFGTLTSVTLGGLQGHQDLALTNTSGQNVALHVAGDSDDSTNYYSGYCGILSGDGSLTKIGTGIITLSNANTYTGGTTIEDGQLNINNGAALGTGAFTIAGVSTIENTSGKDITLSNTNPMIWNADFSFGRANSSHTENLNLGTAPVVLGGNRTVTVNPRSNGSTTLTVAGTISGDYSLTKAGAATLALTGANTYTGDTVVSAGTLRTGGNSVLADEANLWIALGAIVNLNFIGTPDTIGGLYLDGVAQAAGTWGATGSGADHISDVYFSGTGSVLVEVPAPAIPGDANGDGRVDTTDAEIVAANWGTPNGATSAMGDFNGDGQVNAADAAIMAANWSEQTGEAGAVPEPSTAILMLLGFLCAHRDPTLGSTIAVNFSRTSSGKKTGQARYWQDG